MPQKHIHHDDAEQKMSTMTSLCCRAQIRFFLRGSAGGSWVLVLFQQTNVKARRRRSGVGDDNKPAGVGDNNKPSQRLRRGINPPSLYKLGAQGVMAPAMATVRTCPRVLRLRRSQSQSSKRKAPPLLPFFLLDVVLMYALPPAIFPVENPSASIPSKTFPRSELTAEDLHALLPSCAKEVDRTLLPRLHWFASERAYQDCPAAHNHTPSHPVPSRQPPSPLWTCCSPFLLKFWVFY